MPVSAVLPAPEVILKTPSCVIRAFSEPSVLNMMCPFPPASTVSTSVLPSNILSAAIPVKFAPLPTKLVAVMTPAFHNLILLPTST